MARIRAPPPGLGTHTRIAANRSAAARLFFPSSAWLHSLLALPFFRPRRIFPVPGGYFSVPGGSFPVPGGSFSNPADFFRPRRFLSRPRRFLSSPQEDPCRPQHRRRAPLRHVHPSRRPLDCVGRSIHAHESRAPATGVKPAPAAPPDAPPSPAQISPYRLLDRWCRSTTSLSRSVPFRAEA